MSKRILVVDDSQSIRQHVGATLGTAGFEVVEAVDGIDALERLAAGLDVALVLCDINLPRLNGLELLDKLQAQGFTARVPIVMLTTEGSASMMERAKNAGARGWFVKPFKPPFLVAAVKKLMGQEP